MADSRPTSEIYVKQELSQEHEKEKNPNVYDAPLDLGVHPCPDDEVLKASKEKESGRVRQPTPPQCPPDEDPLDVAPSASMFEPEVNIESEEDDLKCSLDAPSDHELGDTEREFKGGGEPSSPLFGDDEYVPSDEEPRPRKGPKDDGRERTHQCPICGKFFLTSSAMNGHVAKGHGTTLGLKFTCHVCGAPGSSRASLKRHLIRTHKIQRVDHPELLTKKCSHCEIGFSSHLLLYEHIRTSHAENLNEYFNCSWCPALMRAKASLIRHIRRTHPGKEEPFMTSEKCPFCEDAFPTRLQLQRHMRDGHPDTPRHVCDICNQGFKFPYMLSRHKVIHEDPERYEEVRRKRKYSVVCEFCGRKFGSKPRLEYHVQVVHTNPPIKVYTCRMCGLTFPTAKQNNRHYRKVHRPERQKVHCGKCNITFPTAEECSKHRALHPNTCDVCQKQFLRRDSLREHLLIHSAPRHQCPHCSKKFTQRSNLKRHIRVHTGEKPYQCPFCQRNFSDKSACNSHMRVHTGYERSVCGVCGASFSKKQRLNYHMRIHTGEGLLYCPLCERPATNSYSLRKHIESHEQPLTKALTTVGFRPLLVSDPEFVNRALQALTSATLQTMDRHENVPNSFIDSRKNNSVEEEDLVDRSRRVLTSIVKEDVDERKTRDRDTSSNPLDPPDEAETEGERPSPFSLTKFLQGLLEQESQKVRSDRQVRRDRRDGRLRARAGASCGGFREGSEEEEEYEELPPMIGDELVRQCLEIIMKDEPPSDVEDAEEDYGEDEMESPLMREVVVKTEQHHIDSEEEWGQQQQESSQSPHEMEETDSPPHFSKPPAAIPKIKISRIAKTEAGSNEDIFVAEIVKNI